MKKIFTMVLCLLTMTSVWADDGGAYFPDKWTYGNIYVKEANSCISLDKEYMEVVSTGYDDHIKAIFAFRNTTDSTVVVPCAFPVVISRSWMVRGDSIYGDNYHDIVDKQLYRMFFNKDVKFNVNGTLDYSLPMTVSEVKAYDKQLRVMEYSDYEEAYPTSEPELYGTNYRRCYYGCEIKQNDEKVELKNVGIETNVEIVGKECKFTMVLHFYHELKFKPGEMSKVAVEYDVNSYLGFYNYSDSAFDYDISTGATWKDGEIGEFVLVTDSKMKPDDNQLNHDNLLVYNIFSARHYKPEGYFHFEKNDNYALRIDFPRYASKKKYNKLYLTDDGQDGVCSVDEDETLALSPMLVNGKILFELDNPCYGPFIANGYIDGAVAYENMKIFSTGVMCEGVYEYDSPFVPDRLWSNYSRAKSMILLCEDQKERHRLHIDDRFPAYPYEVGTQENDGWYAANSSKSAYILRPGKYELTIDEIYRGGVSDTVGLSRIWFYPISQSLIDMLDADSQSDMALFDRLPLLISDIVYSYETPKFGDPTDNYESKNYASETELTSDDDDYAGQEGKSIWLYICILSGILVGVVLFFSKRKKRE